MAEKPIQLAVALHQEDVAVIPCFSKQALRADWTTLPLACRSAGCYLARALTSSEKRSRPLEACLLKPTNIRRPSIKAM